MIIQKYVIEVTIQQSLKAKTRRIRTAADRKERWTDGKV